MANDWMLSLCVLLVMLLVPTTSALAAGATLLAHPGAAAGDFTRFWWTGLSALEQSRPDYGFTGLDQLWFRGLDGRLRTAWCDVPRRPSAMAVLHITDAEQPDAVPQLNNVAQVVFAWRQGLSEADWAPTDATRQPLRRAILDACRLAQTLCGSDRVPTGNIGLVGEGYGADVALAVAALIPNRVTFVVLHEPCSPDPSTSPAPALKWLDPRSFAHFTTARALVSVGTEDEDASPDSIAAITRALPHPPTIWTLPDTGHCPMADVPDWTTVWTAWAFKGTPPPAPQ